MHLPPTPQTTCRYFAVQELVDDILLQFNLQAPECADIATGLFDSDCLLEVRVISLFRDACTQLHGRF